MLVTGKLKQGTAQVSILKLGKLPTHTHTHNMYRICDSEMHTPVISPVQHCSKILNVWSIGGDKGCPWTI